MFRIDPDRIYPLRGPGGQAFTSFVDGLIRTHAAVVGIPDSDIETNFRTNLPDQGVDTRIRSGHPADLTGRLLGPTVWQYKGKEFRLLENSEELLAGDFLRASIADGFAFRLAIADSVTPSQRNDREAELTKLCRGIRANSERALIVSADDLAPWANGYPAFVERWFYPDLETTVLYLGAWTPSAIEATPTYVRVPARDGAIATLTDHVNLARRAASVVRTLQGEAGVGKTRLVHQVLVRAPGMEGLALYCNDEEAARRVATALANAGETRAVVVADECGPAAR